MQSSDLNTVLNCVYQLYGTNIDYIFLDEVQDVEGWHLFVNRLLRQGIHVFLTGSNAKLLSSELATHLTGRYNEIRLFPFSYLEFCLAENISLDSITTQADAARKSALTRYLNDGGMPELHYIKRPQNRRTYIDGLIETIVAKDIVGRFKIHNTEGLRRIAHHLINNSCQIINYDSLLEIASLSAGKTAQKYVSYLSQAFLIHKLQQFSFKSRQRITHEKAYVIDTGFIANRDNALLGENVGWRLENIVLIELLRRYHSAADDIYYYKPSARQKEVDFVVCRQGVVIELIQVAYTIADSKTFKRETDALLNAAKKLNCTNLTLITTDESQDIQIGDLTIHHCSAIDWLLNAAL
jgi:predicted AAA+ superfamily ATPase